MLRLGSVCCYPDRLVDCLKGSAGTGRRLLDLVRVQASQKPFEGQPPQSSPEQACLDVGRSQARALFCMGPKRFAPWLFFECGIRLNRFLRGQESDGYLCSERQGY